MQHLPTLKNLMQVFRKLPGLGPRSSERIAVHLACRKNDLIDALVVALQQVKEELRLCSECYHLSHEEICEVCRDPDRSDPILCVVQDPLMVWRMERSQNFKGKYHVIKGKVNFIEKTMVDEENVQKLIQRLECNPNYELVFAFDSDFDGETTLLYLTEVLKPYAKKMSRLAQGIPVGQEVEFVDERTLGRALENRMEI